MDARDLIRVEESANVAWHEGIDGGYAWRVDVLHDHDGYHVGVAFDDGGSALRVNIATAERLALAILRAATTATVWNDHRSRLN
jgi:hypothetical protein